jgi:ubiquinone/menaquinone biosynthesis C-methylase UbiE
MASMNKPYAFDAIAGTYDRTFTSVSIAALMRQAVLRRADLAFPPGSTVLEMNCGTGEDAVHLASRGVRVLATDISAEMVRVAGEKVAAAGVSEQVRVSQLAWEELDSLGEACFDGALSNFGGLNCVLDLPAAAAALARRLRPGSQAILCVMGPVAVWEWIWFGAHFEFSKAVRRLRRDPRWRGIPLHYPTPYSLSRAFSGGFRVKRISALGLLLPPCLEFIAPQWPRVIAALNRCERLCEALPPLAWMSDHYLLELERL